MQAGIKIYRETFIKNSLETYIKNYFQRTT